MTETLRSNSNPFSYYSVNRGEPGGAICERTGFHGVQHFLDKLVRMAKQGDTNCEELLDMLYAEDLPDDLAKMHELLFNIASRGNVFTEHYNKVFMAMYWNDSRIVWTNDRASDSGELTYNISPYELIVHISYYSHTKQLQLMVI